MSDSTVSLDLQSWDRFATAYTDIVRSALHSISFVPHDCVDDWTQSFFVTQMERNFLERLPDIRGRFRDFLFRCIYNHAVDESRRTRGRCLPQESEGNRGIDSLPAPAQISPEPDQDAGALFALSVLHLAIQKVRAHWVEKGKPEVWMVFEELVLAPLDPTRTPLSRTELLKLFPGRDRQYLDNCKTSVSRVFQRILPALIPAGLSDGLSDKQRFQEWSDLLRSSPTWNQHRLRLAFLDDPSIPDEAPADDSIALDLFQTRSATTLDDITREVADTDLPADFIADELRVLSSFCLTRPLEDYLPTHALELRRGTGACPSHAPRKTRLTLLDLVVDSSAAFELATKERQLRLLIELKHHAKRVHHALREQTGKSPGPQPANRYQTMTVEIAHLVYNLACALAITRCQTCIDGIGCDRLLKNLRWLLTQPWVDWRARRVFEQATRCLRHEHAVSTH